HVVHIHEGGVDVGVVVAEDDGEERGGRRRFRGDCERGRYGGGERGVRAVVLRVRARGATSGVPLDADEHLGQRGGREHLSGGGDDVTHGDRLTAGPRGAGGGRVPGAVGGEPERVGAVVRPGGGLGERPV